MQGVSHSLRRIPSLDHPGQNDIQPVMECWAYQQTHHMTLTNGDLTDTASLYQVIA